MKTQKRFYWIKTNRLIKWLFSNYIWSIATNKKTVYLTFDDGPTEKVTPWVLEQLDQYNAKATFFCIGANIQKNPTIFQSVQDAGHAIGNHTQNHIKGWETANEKYLKDILNCQEQLPENNSMLFRPPYGKIKKNQGKLLRQKGYKIIMWDVLSADFDTTVTPEECLNNVIKNVTSGSIIVFHDSVKAFPRLEYALPRTLAFLSENGYNCEKMEGF